MASTEEMLKIINESFLSEEEKSALRAQLEKEGMNEVFFANMNQFLTHALEKRTHKYEEVMENFEFSYKRIEDEYKERKGTLDSDLDKKLDEVDSLDVVGKESIFDQYYKDVDTIQANYEKQAKEIFSKIFSSAMLDAL